MTHSFRSHFFHLIWSTKNRLPLIQADLQQRLYGYMRGIIGHEGGHLVEIGGMPDHIHMLIQLSNLDGYTSLLRTTKARSSLWVHKNNPNLAAFGWQEGYASYSVSYSEVDHVCKYIQSQEAHHKKITFEEEYRKFVEIHRLKFDQRFLFG